jgi:hypothetical protein
VRFLQWPRVLAALVFLAWAGPWSHAATASAGDPQVVARQLLDRIMAREFHAAADMFHYPKTQSRTERDADRTSIALWLKGLCTELGELKTADTLGQSAPTDRLLVLSVAGGDVAYWSKRGTVTTVVYSFRTSFDREPDTRVSIHLMKTDDRWEVRSFNFGIPATRTNAKEFIGILARKLVP